MSFLCFLQFQQFRRLVRRGERVDDLVEIAVHHLVDAVQRQFDPVLGHTSLREVVGTDLLGAVARSDLAAALRRLLTRFLLQFEFVQFRTQNAHRLISVLQLALLVLTGDHDTRREVRQAHRRVRGVDTLSAVSGRTEYVDTYVFRVNDDVVVDFFGFGHDRDRAGRGVDAAAALRLRDALHAVYARLILQARIRARAADDEHDLQSTISTFQWCASA